MPRCTLDLADAAEQLDTLIDRTERGETIVITRNGQPVAVLAPVQHGKKFADGSAARTRRATLPRQTESAADLVRRMRDEERYLAQVLNTSVAVLAATLERATGFTQTTAPA